jgi:hypothetical protein
MIQRETRYQSLETDKEARKNSKPPFPTLHKLVVFVLVFLPSFLSPLFTHRAPTAIYIYTDNIQVYFNRHDKQTPAITLSMHARTSSYINISLIYIHTHIYISIHILLPTGRQRRNDPGPWLRSGKVSLSQLTAEPPAPRVGDALLVLVLVVGGD